MMTKFSPLGQDLDISLGWPQIIHLKLGPLGFCRLHNVEVKGALRFHCFKFGTQMVEAYTKHNLLRLFLMDFFTTFFSFVLYPDC